MAFHPSLHHRQLNLFDIWFFLPSFPFHQDGHDDYDDDGGDGDYARYNQQLSDFNVQWVSD